MEKQNKTPNELFKSMDANDSGRITEAEFLEFFEKNELTDNKRGLVSLFDECKKPGTNLLDFKTFMKRLDQELKEKAEKESHRDRFDIIATFKKIFIDFQNNQKGTLFKLFQKYDSSSNGYWSYEDYVDFLDDHKKQFLNPDNTGISQKEEQKVFKSIDLDNDGKLSESEFFKRVMPEEYKTFIMDEFRDYESYSRHLDRKLRSERYDDLFELLNTEGMEVKTHLFRRKLYKLGLDTDSKAYERFEKGFDGAYGRNTTKVGRM